MLDKHSTVSLACVILCFIGGDEELFDILFAKICSKNSSWKLHCKMLVQKCIAIIQSDGNNEKPSQVDHRLLFVRAYNIIIHFEKFVCSVIDHTRSHLLNKTIKYSLTH